MVNERRMSDVEALMWNLEKDPHLSSSIATVTFLDRAPDEDRLRARLEAAAMSIPRLRQRVVPSFGRLAPPEWREDPEFDLGYHLRKLRVTGKGTHRDVLDLACDLTNRPFDRTRPLWEFTVVEGVEGARSAMIQKLNHAVTDGEGGIRMSEQFIDVERDAEQPLVTMDPVEAEAGPDSIMERTIDSLSHNLRRGVGIGRRAVEHVGGVVAHPARLGSIGGEAREFVESAVRQIAVSDPAHSPLWSERTLGRRFETLQIPFDDAKTAARSLGGSLNDFFVVGAANAAREYHLARDVAVDELRVSMPVSTRTKGSSGGNAFTPTRLLVPLDIDDPRERFDAIRERLDATKQERAISATNSLAGFVNLLPTSVSVRFARQQVETVDFATSNVRAAPFPLYIAGARIEANYPMGPTGGTAWNITLMSYNGSLDVGVNIDTGAVARPEELRDRLEEAYADLIELA